MSCEIEQTDCRVLMKNGQWLVPEEQKPREYRSAEVTVRTTETVETTIKMEESVPQERPITQPEIITFLPSDPPGLVEELVDKSVEFNCGSSGLDDFSVETLIERLGELSHDIKKHRDIKLLVDRALTDWVHRNGRSLRHIGIRSGTIKDLWFTVYKLLMERKA